MLEIVTIETPTLGDRSYLAHDGTDALVVDPQRDIDRVLAVAAERGVAIRHVLETHVHNDYVTGGRALAAATGATYHVNGDDPVGFERTPVADGELVPMTTSLAVRVLATPGHTFTHLSYVLLEHGRPVAVFTGGSLLFGSTGRPDLLGPDATDRLVHAQYRSAHRLAAELPDDTPVLPTHGVGSFCSSTKSEGNASTIGAEKAGNPVLTTGEESWVRDLLAGLDAFPAYYARMAPANLAAPASPPDLSAVTVADPAELHRRIGAGEWVVDLRTRTAFAAGHLAGALSFGLDGSFATYLGWVLPPGARLTLLGETAQQVAEAQRELVRIGVDRPDAAATGGPADWAGEEPVRQLRVVTFADVEAARRRERVTVLDVRQDLEWAAGHVEGAVHLPLHELLQRREDWPAGELWVHCAAGYRASIAASMLAAAGRQVVLVDDEYDNAADAGVRLVTEVAA